MAYINETMFTDAFGTTELKEIVNKSGTANYDSFKKAVSDADSLIDANISIVYKTPVSEPIPPLITRLSLDISRYYLHDDVNIKDEVIDRNFKHSLEILNDIANKKVILNIEKSSSGVGSSIVSKIGSYSRQKVFSPNFFGRFF